MDTLKVVVIEDEYYVRKGIINQFPWKEMDCEIIGEASNGEDGLEIIERLKPDLCIVDIEMPKMNGISMVERLKKKQYGGEFIFLTAHQKFNYVHSALKLEAIDYLLKPFSRESLEEALKKVRIKMKTKDSASDYIAFPEEENFTVNNAYIHKAIKYVREHYSEDISSNTVSESLDINPAYFCRLFKKETGYTFGRYLTHYRIHIAAGLLANFDLKVSEVAEQVGITDNNYFAVIFKKIMNQTPKEYQDNMKK